MALPVLDAVFASSADLPRRQLLSKWLVEQSGSGSIDDFCTLPERYLYAKIAVELGGPRTEQEYIELPKSYAWSDIYGAIIFNRSAPAAPSGLTLTPLTSSSIKLDWVTNGASVAYSVERSVDGAAFQVIGTTAIGATTATNTGLNIASNYQYRIRGSSGGFFTGYSNTASASTYDANASSFVATSGATDIVAINDFVLGVKALGLWNSMVCWPLRSSQNAASGDTVFSLGGLGTFNGTMVNGPTRGADGMVFDGSDDYITVAFAEKSGYSNFNFGVSLSRPSTGGTKIALQTRPVWIGQGGAGSEMADEITGITYSLPINSLRFPVYNKSGTSVTGYNSGLSVGTMTSSVVMNSDPLLIGTYATNAFFWLGTISFAHVISTSLNASQNLELYDLYKTTLGTGLGLP